MDPFEYYARMDESASLLDPITNLLPNSAIQIPAEDHNLMGDRDASPSSADLYDLIDFGLEPYENQTLNLEDLLNGPTSQLLESEVTPIEMHNASQNLESEDFLNHPIYLPPELEIPPIVFSSQFWELEVHPSHPNSRSLAQHLELEVHPSHPNSQSLESEVHPNHPNPQSLTQPLELEVHPNHPNSQFLELEVHPSHPNSQYLAQPLELEVHPNHHNSQSLESEVLPNNNTSQSSELQVLQDVSTSQSFPNVSNQQHLHAQQYQIAPTSPHCHQFIQLPPPSNKRQKTSIEQCKLEYERTMIMEERNNIISHNPSAFGKSINQGKPRISCHCPKNKCSTRYCSCYKAGVGCSGLCQCRGCSNNYGTKDGGALSTSNSSFSPRERALITTLSNNISSINERQLVGGFNKLMTHNNLYGSDTNQQAVYGTPATNPFDPPPMVQIAVVAQPGASPFAPSRNISQPQGVQIAATTRPQVNLYIADQPQQQHLLMSPANSFAAAGGWIIRNASTPSFRQEVNDINRKYRSRK